MAVRLVFPSSCEFFTLRLEIVDARCCRFRKKQNNKRANEGDMCCTICVMIVIISCFKSEAGHLEHRKSVNCAFQGKKESQLKCRSGHMVHKAIVR